jgi:uncharacterized protein (UPF0332 family)
MLPDELKELSRLRLENAKSLLLASEKLIEIDEYKSSANRAYYAIFSAMRAVLATIEEDYKKHSAVISAFRLNFIKSGKLDVALSDVITNLFRVRNEVDYNDYYVISKTEVIKQIENAKLFVATIESYLDLTSNED